jgi:hypothetical protein
VPALVAEMPDQGPVRLVEGRPASLPLSVVGLGQVHCDDAVLVPSCRRLIGPGKVGEEAERQAPLRVVALRDDLQADRREVVGHPPLRCLEACPQLQVSWLAQVGDDIVQPARQTVPLRAGFRDHPVADVVVDPVGTPAEAAGDLRRDGRPALLAAVREGTEGVKLAPVRQEAQGGPTPLAADVFEVRSLPAVLTGEDPHRRPLSTQSSAHFT